LKIAITSAVDALAFAVDLSDMDGTLGADSPDADVMQVRHAMFLADIFAFIKQFRSESGPTVLV
jgi:hypothetical protein